MHLPDFAVFARNGEVLATRALGLTLYFETAVVDRIALGAMVVEAIGLVTPHARWVRLDATTRNDAMSPALAREAADYVRHTLASGADAELAIDSGATLDGVGPWALRYADSPGYEGDLLGYVQFHMPPADADTLLRLALRWFGEVNFLHGYGGLSLNYDHGDVDAQRNMAMRGHCERFLGVNLSDLVTERRALLADIKNAQWLTLLSHELLARDRAQATVLRSLVDTQATSHGVLLRAGDMPLAGDAHRREDLPALREMNAMLSPWLIENLFPLPGFADEEDTRKWLHALRAKT